jgi:hypothetical protein
MIMAAPTKGKLTGGLGYKEDKHYPFIDTYNESLVKVEIIKKLPAFKYKRDLSN